MKLAQDPNNQDLENQLKDVNDEIIQEQNKMLGGPDGLARAADKQKQLLEDLNDAVRRGDQAQVDRFSDKLAKAQDNLSDQIQTEANSPNQDPERKKLLEQLDSDLKKAIPEQIVSGKAFAKNPKDKAAQNKLEDLNYQNRENLDKLSTPLAGAIASKVEGDIDRMVKAAKSGDPKGVEEAAKNLPVQTDDLVRQLKADARNTSDPQKKRDLLEAANDLENLVPGEIEEAKKLAQNPNNKERQDKLNDIDNKVHEALSKVGGPKADLRDAINRHQQEREKLADAVKKGDVKAAEEAANRLPKTGNKVEQKAKDLISKTDDPQQKKEIVAALEDFKKANPDEGKAGLAAAKNPNDKGVQDNFDNAAKNVDQSLHDLTHPEDGFNNLGEKIEGQLDELAHTAKEGDKPGTDEKNKIVTENVDKLLGLAKEKSKQESVPVHQKKINNSVEKIQKLLPQLTEAAALLAKNPDDKHTQENFNNLNDELKGEVRALTHPEDEHVTTAKKAKDDIDQLVKAAKAGDQNKVDQLAKSLPETLTQLETQSKDAANKSDNSQYKKQIQESLKELKDRVPQVIADSQKVAKNPGDQKEKEKLDKNAKETNDLLDKVFIFKTY